jgi:hypothetical protein
MPWDEIFGISCSQSRTELHLTIKSMKRLGSSFVLVMDTK